MTYVRIVNKIRPVLECVFCNARWTPGEDGKGRRCPQGCTDEALRVGAVVDNSPRLLKADVDHRVRIRQGSLT